MNSQIGSRSWIAAASFRWTHRTGSGSNRRGAPWAALFGQAQHLAGTAVADGVTTAFGRLQRACPGVAVGDEVDVLLRPTAVALRKTSDPAETAGRVDDLRFLGDRYLVLVNSEGHTLRASVPDVTGIHVGDHVAATFDLSGAFVYRAKI